MKVTYTEEAERDLIEIGSYTLSEWGEDQYVAYMSMLEECCERVLPGIKHAQAVPQRAGLFRYRCARHIVYFRRVRSGIAVTRILHELMLPSRHL